MTSSVQLLLGGVEMVHQGEYQILLLPTRIVWAPTILKMFGQSLEFDDIEFAWDLCELNLLVGEMVEPTYSR